MLQRSIEGPDCRETGKGLGIVSWPDPPKLDLGGTLISQQPSVNNVPESYRALSIESCTTGCSSEVLREVSLQLIEMVCAI